MNVPQWNSPSTSAADPPSDPGVAPRLDALLPGTRLEEFEIERVLGSSGFGIVYLAIEARSERRVAIKEYLPVSLATRAADGARVELRAPAHAEAFERGRRAFIDEALLLTLCDHPSLVKVLGSWHANGTVYRAMPHYAGHTLASLRQAMDEPPDEPSLRALLDGVLGALEVLHAAGSVHGDIAPASILLLPDDHPVLLDGGAARRAIVGEQTRAMMTLLEPSYAAPEQVAPSRERPVGAWTDLYALGAVMHYCVSGQTPPVAPEGRLRAHAPLATVVQRLRGRYPFLHVSRQFAAAIDAALALDAAKRPRSVAEFRALLDSDALTELPIDEKAAREASNDPAIGPPSTLEGVEPELNDAIAHDGAPITAPYWRGARRREPRLWPRWAVAAGLLLAAGAAAWNLLPVPGPEVLVSRLPSLPQLMQRTDTPPPAPAPAPKAEPAAPVVAQAAPSALPQLPEAPPAAIGPAPEPQAATPPVVQAPAAQAPAAPPPVAERRGAAPAPAKSVAANTTAPRSRRLAARGPSSPREACGERTQFSLYRCMQTQCAQAAWSQHAQCKRLRVRDEVS